MRLKCRMAANAPLQKLRLLHQVRNVSFQRQQVLCRMSPPSKPRDGELEGERILELVVCDQECRSRLAANPNIQRMVIQLVRRYNDEFAYNI